MNTNTNPHAGGRHNGITFGNLVWLLIFFFIGVVGLYFAKQEYEAYRIRQVMAEVKAEQDRAFVEGIQRWGDNCLQRSKALGGRKPLGC